VANGLKKNALFPNAGKGRFLLPAFVRAIHESPLQLFIFSRFEQTSAISARSAVNFYFQ
jgi:hypothetical protein